MSAWHRDNPELYEQGYEPWGEYEARADELRNEPPPKPLPEPQRSTEGPDDAR